jgi:GNAT superfamily N-acetyltransferase
MLRKATVDDITILTDHHLAMFREIHQLMDKPVSESDFEKTGRTYREKLHRQLTNGTCTAWVYVSDSSIVASAAVSLLEGIPVPDDPLVTVAFVHSVYTLPEYRRRGYARQLMQEILMFCEQRGIRRIDLVASAAGEGVYTGLGFSHLSGAMRLMRK